MLERYFVKPATIDRIRGSWLAPEIERYVEWMASQGYAIRNFYRRVPILCRFAEFAKLQGATDAKSAAAHVEGFASHWLASHVSQGGPPQPLGRPGISVDSGLGESDEGEIPCPQETNTILGPRREPGGRLSRLQNRRPRAGGGQRGARRRSFWNCCVARTWRPRLASIASRSPR